MSWSGGWRASAIAVALMIGCTVPAAAQEAGTCDDNAGFSRLDFWLGDWKVTVGEEWVGDNRIERILSGCAVMEHWVDSGGGEGKSLFYYTPSTDTWKQVWVTGSATAVGGVKEKTLITEFDGVGVRFQGEIPLADGSAYFDRTTLTPLADGSVRQVIEVSRDGSQWRTTFDAVYTRPR